MNTLHRFALVTIPRLPQHHVPGRLQGRGSQRHLRLHRQGQPGRLLAKGTVTLALEPAHSQGRLGAYRPRWKYPTMVPSWSCGSRWPPDGIYFANTDLAPRDFEPALPAPAATRPAKWTFTKFYHEPESAGRNHGTEYAYSAERPLPPGGIRVRQACRAVRAREVDELGVERAQTSASALW